MDEEADEGALPKDAGEYVLRRDLRRTDPGCVEVVVEAVEVKEMALDDC